MSDDVPGTHPPHDAGDDRTREEFLTRPEPPASEPSPPRVTARGYAIGREISRGGQAVIFEAIQESTGRKVAIRVLREGALLTAEQRARFEREVQILAALQHPNIVNIIDRGATAEGAPFLAMEYIEGVSLDQHITDYYLRNRGRTPDPAEMLRLFMKIADAVSAAHLRGIVHRDLKPGNVLIDARGEPHILDFGLARTAIQAVSSESGTPRPVTVTGQFLGSLPWASPEQAEGRPGQIDIRSDVYSLGIILYQMLTDGRFPYDVSGSMRDVLNNIITTDPTPPSKVLEAKEAARSIRRRRFRLRRRKAIDETVEAIVLKALAKKPENRYQSASDFARDVASYLSGQPTVAAGMAALARQRRASLVRLAGVVCGVLAVCGLGMLAMWKYLPQGQPAAPEKSPPEAAAPATPAAAQPQQRTLDLLALTDVVKDRHMPSTVKGNTWERRGASLVYVSDGKAGVIAAPVAIRARSYEFEIEYVRLTGEGCLNVGLPLEDGRIVPLYVDGAGLKFIDRREGPAWPAGKGARSRVIVRVDRGTGGTQDHLAIRRDDYPVFDWHGDLAGFGQPTENAISPGQPLSSLYSRGDSYEICVWQLRIFEGEAAEVRGSGAKVAQADDAFAKEVAALAPEEQVARVVAKLKELNPGYDGLETHKIENGQVVELSFSTVAVANLSPVRALAGLKKLGCEGEKVPGGKERKGLLTDLSPLRGLKLEELRCSYNGIVDLGPLTGLPLKSFTCYSNHVSDLGPLASLPLLRSVLLSENRIGDLSPLKGKSLQTLMCNESQVKDLTPLTGMPLKILVIGRTSVSDLSPLRGLPLDEINLGRSPVGDLSPLAGMQLKSLKIDTPVDLSPLRGMPLTELVCVFLPQRIPADVLRSLKMLKTVNNLPVAEFWKQVAEGKTPNETAAPSTSDGAADAFLKEIAALAPEEQVKRVVAKLKELNPGYDGVETHKIENGRVEELSFSTAAVADLSPVRALSGLRTLKCEEKGAVSGELRKGLLADLSPLRGLRLEALSCSCNRISDLSPLAGMPLRYLTSNHNYLVDLRPLAGMPLLGLGISGNNVSDLSPLKGMALTNVDCSQSPIADLAPLAGLPLTRLYLDFKPERDAAVLRSIKTLEQVNGVPVAEFWKQVAGGKTPVATVAPAAPGAAADAFAREVAALAPEQQVARVVAKLRELNPGYDGLETHKIVGGQVVEFKCSGEAVSDISPLRALPQLTLLWVTGTPEKRSPLANLSPLGGMALNQLSVAFTRVDNLAPLKKMPLRWLYLDGTSVSNLAPLRGMPLKHLSANQTAVTDISALRDMPTLEVLRLHNTAVADLAPLRGIPLRELACQTTLVNDLSPLAGMPLKILGCNATKVVDLSPLRNLPLEQLNCNFKPERDSEPLRSIKTLQTINNLPAAEFWKQVAEGKAPGATAEAAPDDAAWQNAINLLPLIDPQKDSVSGTWGAEKGELTATDEAIQTQKIQPPYRPAGEYDYRVSFTTRSGNADVAVGLSAAGRSFVFYMKRYTDAHVIGFEAIDGKAVSAGPTAVRIPHLEHGRRYTVVVQVRKQGVAAYLDGKRMAEYATDYHDMAPWPAWKFKDDTLLGFGCSKTTAVFHEVKVREVTGKGEFLRDTPAAPAAAPGPWTDLLALADPAKHTVQGAWERRGAVLAVATGKNFDRLTIPATCEGSYELEVEFVRTAGSMPLGIIFPTGAASPNLIFGTTVGIGNLNRKKAYENESTLKFPAIENKRTYRISIHVAIRGDQARIEVGLDDKPVLAWEGPRSALSENNDWALPDSGTFGLGSMGSPYEFRTARMRKLADEATP